MYGGSDKDDIGTINFTIRKEIVRMLTQKFLVGGYLRLSNEDGENKQSESIDNQQLVLKQYLEKHTELELVDIYIDDGYTGMNYDRGAFQRMMKDIELGKINTIVTKDLSRLGRDQVDTAKLLKKDFVLKKVRYIAIDDNIDTFSKEQNDIVVPFKILVNDFYSQDISVKIRAALNSKRKNGEFIGAFAPYGYKKDENNNNMLVPDEIAAEVVNRIYVMFLNGYGKLMIARKLNEEGILCPTEYKQSNLLKYHNSRKLQNTGYWTYSTIHRILQNEVYIGNMIQHKQEKIAYNIKQHRAVPKDQQILVKENHQPIIDRGIFDSVQQLLKMKNRTSGFKENITIYAGILKCGDCGRSLAKSRLKTKSNSYVYYKCGTYKQYGKNQCSSHTIREDILNHIVLQALKERAKELLDRRDIEILKEHFYEIQMGKEEAKLDEINRLTANLQKENLNMLRMLAKGIIQEDDFVIYKRNMEREEVKLKKRKEQFLERQMRKKEEIKREEYWLQNFVNYMNIEEITREILIAFVEQIQVFENNQIDITFRFREQ